MNTSTNVKFPFPENENGVPLNIFLVTLKNVIDKDQPTVRYVVFAIDGAEAHEKIMNLYQNSDFGFASFRISIEHAHIASGNTGIIEL